MDAKDLITHLGYSTFNREDECPDTLLRYILPK